MSEDPSTPTTPTATSRSRPSSGGVGLINIPLLARICDDIRATILSYRFPGPWHHTSELCGLLSAFLGDEDNPSMRITLDTILACRLDKLLEDILEPLNRPHEGQGPRDFVKLDKMACQLQKKWMARFGSAYFSLDEVRCEELRTVGRLRGLTFSVKGRPGWKITDTKVDCPCLAELETGEWFINMASAYMHGMTGDSIENLKVNDTRVLPMLWGKEENFGLNVFRYIRDGRSSDVVYSLLSHVGHRVHVLRGYRLRSKFAPVAGIRYDGV